MINPTSYDAQELLRKIKEREQKSEERQKYCPNCRKGMYKTENGTIQCENCEFEELAE